MKLRKKILQGTLALVLGLSVSVPCINVSAAKYEGSYTFGRPSGAYTSNYWVYETSGSREDITLAVYTDGNKKLLKDMWPSDCLSSSVVAKTNCGFMRYGANNKAFLGVFKTPNGKLYMHGQELNGPRDTGLRDGCGGSEGLNDKFYPLLCIRHDGSSAIRWPSYDEFQSTYNACRLIISGGQALVYEGKNVFVDETIGGFKIPVRDNKGVGIRTDRYNSNLAKPSEYTARTLLGRKSDNTTVMVVAEGINIQESATLMKYLDCYNAIALDGSIASQMQVGGNLYSKTSYNQSGLSNDSNYFGYYGTAVVAYKKY